MRRIFVFWVIFLVMLIIGISLAISSRSALKREEKRAEELRKTVISRPSRLPKQPVASEAKAESFSSEGEKIPPLQSDIPVQINANSLEISVPHPASQDDPAQQENPVQQEEPASQGEQ